MHHGALEAGGQVFDSRRRFLSVTDRFQLRLPHILCDRGFQSAKTKIRPPVAHARSCELDGLRISLARQPFDDWPTRIAEPEEIRDLIESFAGGFVARGAEYFVISWIRVGDTMSCVAVE